MNARARAYLVACAAAIGFALGYVLPPFARLSNLIYHPVERRYFIADHPGAVAMGYYGQVLYAITGALVATALAWALTARSQKPPSSSTMTLMGAWALSLLTLVALYFTWLNWP